MPKIHRVTDKHILLFINLGLFVALIGSVSQPSLSWKTGQSSETNLRSPASVTTQELNINNLEDMLSVYPSCENENMEIHANHIRLNMVNCNKKSLSVEAIHNLTTQSKPLLFKTEEYTTSDFFFLKQGENRIELQLSDGSQVSLHIARK